MQGIKDCGRDSNDLTQGLLLASRKFSSVLLRAFSGEFLGAFTGEFLGTFSSVFLGSRGKRLVSLTHKNDCQQMLASHVSKF